MGKNKGPGVSRTCQPRACSLFILFALWLFPYSSPKGFYLEVPYVHQVKNYCGPAALSMVLRFWDQSVDQYELAGHFDPFPSKGLSGAQMKELAARYGFSAYSFSGQTETLREHLGKGRPVIVALSSSRLLDFNHFVVLVGWDTVKQEWIVHDPADGPYRRRPARELTAKWGQLENWTLLVLPEAPK